MQFTFFLLLTIAAFFVCITVYVILQAIVGRLVGTKAERIEIGTNLFIRNFRTTIWRTELSLGFIPLCGSTKFIRKEEEHFDDGNTDLEIKSASVGVDGNIIERPICYHNLPLRSRALLMIVGPISSLTIGIFLMSIPVAFGWRQVAVDQDLPIKIAPSSIPSLGISNRSATLAEQAHLANDTLIAFGRKAITGSPMTGWGGVVAWIATCGYAGRESYKAWVSCVALIFVGNGLINLLPIPTLNGGSLLSLFAASVFGGINERLEVRLAVAGVLLLLAVCAFLIWLDVIWFFSLVW